MHFSFKNGMNARRRSGHRSWPITGGLPILAATMACSLFSGRPEPTTSPPSTSQAKPSPSSPRTTSAAEIVEAAAPSTIGGQPFYTIEYGESGAATRCTETRFESNTFSITRQSW